MPHPKPKHLLGFFDLFNTCIDINSRIFVFNKLIL